MTQCSIYSQSCDIFLLFLQFAIFHFVSCQLYCILFYGLTHRLSLSNAKMNINHMIKRLKSELSCLNWGLELLLGLNYEVSIWTMMQLNLINLIPDYDLISFNFLCSFNIYIIIIFLNFNCKEKLFEIKVQIDRVLQLTEGLESTYYCCFFSSFFPYF